MVFYFIPLLLMLLWSRSSFISDGWRIGLEGSSPSQQLNPLNGLKRMFGLRSLVELAKSFLKFSLVAAVLAYMVYDFSDELIVLSAMNFEPAMEAAAHMIGLTSVLVTVTLVFIAMIDVPFQSFEFTKRMRMTKQEVKDEFKDVEGRQK